MKNINVNHLKIYIFVETLVVSILCYIFHFLFDWLNNNLLIAPFVNVNESVWEHLKLPTNSFIIFAVVTIWQNKKYKNYVSALGTKIIFCTIFIPLLYYILKSINVKGELVNILILYVSIIVSEIYEYYIITRNIIDKKYNSTFIIIILILQILFVIFTYHPLKLDIFKDNRYNSYGIIDKKSKEEL